MAQISQIMITYLIFADKLNFPVDSRMVPSMVAGTPDGLERPLNKGIEMTSDIREILKSLDDADKRKWEDARSIMRRAYLTAHNTVLGIEAWDVNDDALLDWIDIRLVDLFERSGRFAAVKETAEQAAVRVEADIRDMVKGNTQGQVQAPNNITPWKAQ